ncbi:MAG: hypothetical protein IKT82_03370 [Bacteroidaceae bacterium]|nr:hypothetical protein [Bacteroidaceae bacterium]
MKKFLLASVALATTLFASCTSEPKLTYAEILDKEVPSVAKIDSLVLTALEWEESIFHYNNLPYIVSQFEGFEVIDSIDGCIIKILKNARIVEKENEIGDYYYTAEVVNPDSFATAIWMYLPSGVEEDAYDSGYVRRAEVSIALFNDSLYNAQLKRIENAGYEFDEESNTFYVDYEKYGNKPACSWYADSAAHTVTCSYDAM